MKKSAQMWLKKMEADLASHHLLHHPFYAKWSEGALTRESLRGYAREYYQLVAAIPELVGAVQAKAPTVEMTAMLAGNLEDEEQHPELWLQFGEALGLSRQEILGSTPLPETAEAVHSLHRLVDNGTFLQGVAALWGFESQVPEVSEKKIQGLTSFYGITAPRSLEYFEVHRTIDEKHTAVEEGIFQDLAQTPKAREEVQSAARVARDAVWRLLDGVLRVYAVMPA